MFAFRSLSLYSSIKGRLPFAKIRRKVTSGSETTPTVPTGKGYLVYVYDDFQINLSRFAGFSGVGAMLISAYLTIKVKLQFDERLEEVQKESTPYLHQLYNGSTGYAMTAFCLVMAAGVFYLTTSLPGRVVKKIVLSVDRQTAHFVLYNTWSNTKIVRHPVKSLGYKDNRVYIDRNRKYYLATGAKIPNKDLFNVTLGLYQPKQ